MIITLFANVFKYHAFLCCMNFGILVVVITIIALFLVVRFVLGAAKIALYIATVGAIFLVIFSFVDITSLIFPPTTPPQSCLDSGGIFNENTSFCNLPLQDGGQGCSDSSDCSGLCLYAENQSIGLCQPYEELFSCQFTFVNGSKGLEVCPGPIQ